MTAVPPPTDLAAWLTELEAARDEARQGGWPAADFWMVRGPQAFDRLLAAVREFAELADSYPLGTDVPVYRLHRVLAALGTGDREGADRG